MTARRRSASRSPSSAASSGSSRRTLRCAIYTRVSTDAGLEQDFNSLDAQREASEAYIKSQAHEGWTLVRDRFDDGGFSGGSMERPALQRLLDDVCARKIDVIVVYKVDRLTRSLADFAKLVELFDAHGVSFVSVTQSFNTTTSMGRLTLNVLLSFAQFEREVTGERIRDKIAASKKKGIWMGGVVPLGYRVENRALHIVEEHARIVRMIFERYLAIGSVVRLKQALDGEGVRVPVRIDGANRTTGGGSFSRGHLHKVLTNPIHIGRLAHKGEVHEGQHEAIVDRSLWDSVQAKLADQAQTVARRRTASEALLLGKLFDDRGNLMTPTWAQKGGRRWRYYVSQALLQGRKQDAGSVARVPAKPLEEEVERAVMRQLESQRHRPASSPDSEPDIRDAIDYVTIRAGAIDIVLANMVDSDTPENPAEPTRISIAWTPPSSRRHREIIQADDHGAARPRPMRVEAQIKLLRALRSAHGWLDELTADPTATTESIAQRELRSERSVRQLLSLAFVAPDIVAAAIERRLPRGFGMSRFMNLPPDWTEQRRALGLPASASR